jgi:hypothetical protein
MKTVFMCVTLIGLAYSQSAGMFANSGESLIGIEGQYDSEDIDGGSATTISIGGSYVLNGNLEIGASYDMGEVKNDDDSDFDFDVGGSTFGGYYHMKENETFPLSIKIGGFYGNAKASADWLDDAGVEIESTASAFGGGVYKNIYQKDAMTIKGFFNFHSIATETTTKIEESADYYAFSDTETDEYNSIRIGLAIRNGNLFVKPSIGRNDDDSSFDVTFGFLLPQ